MKTEEGKNTHVSHQHTEPTVKLIKWGDLDLWKQDSTTTKKTRINQKISCIILNKSQQDKVGLPMSQPKPTAYV